VQERAATSADVILIVPLRRHLARVAGTMSSTKMGHFPASGLPPSLLLAQIWMTLHFRCHQM
jgi:hypothetical protein